MLQLLCTIKSQNGIEMSGDKQQVKFHWIASEFSESQDDLA